MSFVTTGLAIAGLASIAVPIIIHLLWRQRKRPVEWAAMRFLLEAFRRHRRRLQVEQLLLLAARCLVLALLGLALARPIMRAGGLIDGGTDRVVLLVVDNGLASGAREAGSPQTALARHVEQAKSVVESLGDAEAVGLITASRPARGPILPPSLDHDAVVEVLDHLTPSEAPTDLAGALRTAQQAARSIRETGQSVVVMLFSEFRRGSAPLEAPLPENLFDDSSPDDDVTLLASPAASEARPNVQVTDIVPVRRVILPGATDGSQQVTVHLSRHGGELGADTSRIRLEAEGLGAPITREVTWSPGDTETSASFSVDFLRAAGSELGLTATVDDADALDADNRRHIALDVREKVRVAMVSPPTFERLGAIDQLQPGQWIRRALRTSDTSPFDVVDVPPASLDDVDLRTADVAIVTRPDRLADNGWQALRSFLEEGGLVMLIPPSDVNVHPWTDRVETDLGLPWRLDLETRTYAGGLLLAAEQPRSELLRLLQEELTDLTRSLAVNRMLGVDMERTQAEVVLVMEDGSPLLIMGGPRFEEETSGDGGEGTGASSASTPPSSGLAIYLATAPELREWTNLPSQVFMVPLFQESVRQGLNLIRASRRLVVGDQGALVGLGRGGSTLIGPEEERIDLDARRRPERALPAAGLYEVVDAASQPVGMVAVNVDSAAGRTDIQSQQPVASWLSRSGEWSTFDPANPASMLMTTEGGADLATWLLIAVLVLAVLETILARRFSHAYRAGPGDDLHGGLKPTIYDARGAGRA